MAITKSEQYGVTDIKPWEKVIYDKKLEVLHGTSSIINSKLILNIMENENLNYNPSLDEIVFENRNKEYGAYDLRSSYRRILTRSMIIGTLIFCIAAITPFVVMKIKQLAAKEKQK